jgi:hypothetical protein
MTATRRRNTSAAIADRLTEQVEGLLDSPTDRVKLVAELSEASAADIADAKRVADELVAAEKAVEEDPYHQKLLRLADARAAALGKSFAPEPRTNRARDRLLKALPPGVEDALYHLQCDLITAQDRVLRSDVYGRPNRNKAAQSRLAELREVQSNLHELRFAADPLEAIDKVRARLKVPESPRVMRGPRPAITYPDD